ncbi:MAG: AsmA-like C-terminal region-containing protein, partial [Thermodesulfobacteriota bacterium]
LRLDRLLAAAASLPKGPPAEQPAGPARKTDAGSRPPTLTAQGRLHVGQASYEGLLVRDLGLRYTWEDGVLTVTDLAAGLAQGALTGELRLDAQGAAPAFQGSTRAQGLELAELLAASPQAAGKAQGKAELAARLSGASFDWPQLRESLQADGTFGADRLQLKRTKAFVAMARLLDLPELEEPAFDRLAGSFRVAAALAQVNAILEQPQLRLETDGQVGLDGSLDLPVTLDLAEPLAGRLRAQTPLGRLLIDREGRAQIQLRLTGTASDPQARLDAAAAQERLQDALRQKTREEIQRVLPGMKTLPPAPPPTDTDLRQRLERLRRR